MRSFSILGIGSAYTMLIENTNASLVAHDRLVAWVGRTVLEAWPGIIIACAYAIIIEVAHACENGL